MKYKVTGTYQPDPFPFDVEVEARSEFEAERKVWMQIGDLTADADWLDDGELDIEFKQITFECEHCRNELLGPRPANGDPLLCVDCARAIDE